MDIGKEIEALGQYLRRQRTQYMENFGLKGTQVQLILAIANHPGISQDQLAAAVGVDKSNVARQIAVLEACDYVTRQSDTDNRRKLCLQLTERSVRLLPRLEKADKQWEEILLQELSHWEVSQFSSLIARIRKVAEENDPNLRESDR